MTNSEVERLFYKKIEANYSDYMKEILSLEPATIVENADEIAAAKLVYNEMKNKMDFESMSYLVQFENPLEIVRDKWLEEHNVPVDDEMDHVLWSIRNYEDAVQDYTLDEGVTM